MQMMLPVRSDLRAYGRRVIHLLVSFATIVGLGTVVAADLAWTSHSGHRFVSLAVPTSGRPGFTRLLPEHTGLFFTNHLAEGRSLTNHVLLNGSGVAAGDVDGDGWCDLYLCGLDGPNRLFRNLGGWRFVEMTNSAVLACGGQDSTGAVWADLDGDGDLDLLVGGIGVGVRSFANDGKGTFRETTEESGLASRSAAMSMALADVDGNGTLDLYVVNYRSSTMRDSVRMQIRVGMVGGRRVITRVNNRPTTDPELIGRFELDETGGLVENGEADAFYRNEGGGKFVRVPFVSDAFLDEDGRRLVNPPYDWGLSAAFRDLNHDGAPDLYVCNDLASPDRIWMNDGHGRFRALPSLAVRKTPWFSMGIDFADVNRDGWDDFFVTDMLARDHLRRHTQENDHRSTLLPIGSIDVRPQYARSMLYLNQGDGTFAEIANHAGLAATDWSWAPVFLDVDLDGYEDLLITTGFERDVQDRDVAMELEAMRRQQRQSEAEMIQARKKFPRLAQPNLAFRQRGDLRFEEMGAAWGFNHHGVSQGMALADLDHDGDLDVVINNLNDGLLVLRNECSAPRMAVRLRGHAPNTSAIGARIQVTPAPAPSPTIAVPVQSQVIMSGGRYLSGDEALRVFALGASDAKAEIEVTWPDGARTRVPGRANQLWEITQPAANELGAKKREPTEANASARASWFEDQTELLGHRHVEAPFDDFERQRLLPWRLSQLGPGVAWGDLNGDGRDDLVVGTGRGGRLAAWTNDGSGARPFRSTSIGLGLASAEPATRDQTGVLLVPLPGGTQVLVGSSNYEDAGSAGAFVLEGTPRGWTNAVPGPAMAVGPLAVGAFGSENGLVLFAGGRSIPGRYPEAADSHLFRRTGTAWVPETNWGAALQGAGLVSGAVFSDLTGDGWPELILACEWGPLRIFQNDRGRPVPWDPPVSNATAVSSLFPIGSSSPLSRLTGWWNGVATADVDGDGRLDFIASNWGSNTRNESYRAQPLRLYHGDFDRDGRVQLIEAYTDPARRQVMPWATWDRMGDSFLMARTRFRSFREYGQATVADILGDRMPLARELSVVWLESAVFLNRGGRFEVRPLPMAAQQTPAFAVCAGDFDGDGHVDLFLSQNFFATDARTARLDAGRGLCLRGDGRGDFTPVPVRESGVRIDGEQRGAALGDYDADGRLDLVVTQNGAATRLFRNIGGRPGLRVRLAGPAGNPGGLGAIVRLISGTGPSVRAGAAQEVRAGSGYWSQDSLVLIFARHSGGERVQVRWPGGRIDEWPLAKEAREVLVEHGGALRVVR